MRARPMDGGDMSDEQAQQAFAALDGDCAVDARDGERIARLAAAARGWGGARRATAARRTGRVLAAVAAVVLLAAGSAAGAWWWRASTAAPAAPAAIAVAPVIVTAAARIAARGAATENVAVSLAPAAAPAEPRAPAAAPAARRPRAARQASTAAGMLRDASEARRDGELARAASLYRGLQAAFPTSPEAVMSAVPLGGVLLDGGRAREALAQFDRYLRAAGGRALAPEALYGRGRALERLGDGGRERETWARLLADFPGSAYASHGRRRLADLEP